MTGVLPATAEVPKGLPPFCLVAPGAPGTYPNNLTSGTEEGEKSIAGPELRADLQVDDQGLREAPGFLCA
jgi:hypothetical protein